MVSVTQLHVHIQSCTLVLAAFRRLLRQEGTFVHQQRGIPHSILWWCETLIQNVCQDATKELRVPLLQPVKKESQCVLQTAHIDMVRVLPISIDTMPFPLLLMFPRRPESLVTELVSFP